MTRIEPPPIDRALRRPCPGPDLSARTAADVARVVVQYDDALTCANGRIVAIDEILTGAERATTAETAP